MLSMHCLRWYHAQRAMTYMTFVDVEKLFVISLIHKQDNILLIGNVKDHHQNKCDKIMRIKYIKS
jgi:hypothetical protein